MVDAGFHPRSEFTWDFHYSYYWDLTQRLYREEFDPSYDGDLVAGVPFCQNGTPELRRGLRLRRAPPAPAGRWRRWR